MFAKVCSTSVSGIEAYPIEVEVNSGWGDSVTVIVGLPVVLFSTRDSQNILSLVPIVPLVGYHLGSLSC